ncbi:MAG: hypothetical protein AB7S80_10980 [Rhizobiaceae bacterium]
MTEAERKANEAAGENSAGTVATLSPAQNLAGKAALPANDPGAAVEEAATPKRKVRIYSMPDEAYPEGTTVIQDDFNDGNPFNEEDWRVVLNAWVGFILRLVLVLAAGFSVVQYLQQREEARVSETLKLVDLWEQDQYQAAQQALRLRLAALNEKYADEFPASGSDAEKAFYFRKIGQEAMTSEGGTMPLPEFDEQFGRVVYFLNRVSFCVAENICSSDVSDAYFADYAVSFWRYFAGYAAQQRRDGVGNYAKAIEQYVKDVEARTAE